MFDLIKSHITNIFHHLLQLSSPKIARQDDNQAIFPDLIKCRTAIEKILPSITSMSWSRGAGNFFRSQNIRTIGDLCALSESQIESLPIRSPKVCVCKTALSRFLKQQEKQMPTHTTVSKPGKQNSLCLSKSSTSVLLHCI